jgi:hypothetical protein
MFSVYKKQKIRGKKLTESTILVFGFGGIADAEYSVLVETNYSAEYSAETGIRSNTRCDVICARKGDPFCI